MSAVSCPYSSDVNSMRTDIALLKQSKAISDKMEEEAKESRKKVWGALNGLTGSVHNLEVSINQNISETKADIKNEVNREVLKLWLKVGKVSAIVGVFASICSAVLTAIVISYLKK